MRGAVFEQSDQRHPYNPRALWGVELVCPECTKRVGKLMKAADVFAIRQVEELHVNQELGGRLHCHLNDVCPHFKDKGDNSKTLDVISRTWANWLDNENCLMHPAEAFNYEKAKRMAAHYDKVNVISIPRWAGQV